jgi:hypothetical protein
MNSANEMSASAACPSDLALELHLANAGQAPLVAHVAECDSCRLRLASMEEQGRRFLTAVYPATLDAVLRSCCRPTWRLRLARRWQPWTWAAATLACALIVARWSHGVGSEQERLKGRPIELLAYSSTPGAQSTPEEQHDLAGATRQLRDGEPVAKDAALRFQVRVAAPCHLWLFSVDDAGVVSRLYPASGDLGADASGTASLPGGVVLYGKEGPERFFAVCSSGKLDFAQLADAARSAARQGLRKTKLLGRLPAEAWQTSLLLEKRQ